MPLTAFRPRPDQGAAAEDPNQAQTNLLAIPVDVITSHVIPALPGSCRRRLRVTCRALRRAVDCSVASLLVDRPGVRASTFPGLTHIRLAAWRPNLGLEELHPLLLDLPHLPHLREFRLLLAPAAAAAPPKPPPPQTPPSSLLARLRSGSPAASHRPAVPSPAPSRVPDTASGQQLGNQQRLDVWRHHGGPLTASCSRCGCAMHPGGGTATWGSRTAGADAPEGPAGVLGAAVPVPGPPDSMAGARLGGDEGGSPQALPMQHANVAAGASPFRTTAAAAAAPPPREGSGIGSGIAAAGAEAPSPPRPAATAAAHHQQAHAGLHPQPWPERMLQRVLYGIQDMPYMSAVLSRMRLVQAPRAVAGDGRAMAAPPGDWTWEDEAGAGAGGGSALLPSQGTGVGARAAAHNGVGYLSAEALVLLLCALGSAQGRAGGGDGCGEGVAGLHVGGEGRGGCCTCCCRLLAVRTAGGMAGPSAGGGGNASASGYPTATRCAAMSPAAGRPGAVCDGTSASSSPSRSCVLPASVLQAARSSYNSPANGEGSPDGGGTPQHGASGRAASSYATRRSHGGGGGGGAGADGRTPDITTSGTGGCPCSGDAGGLGLEGRAEGQGNGASGCRRQEQLWEWEDKWSRSRPTGDGTPRGPLCGAAGMDFLWASEGGSVSGASTISHHHPAQYPMVQRRNARPEQGQAQRGIPYTAVSPSTITHSASHGVASHASPSPASPFLTACGSTPSTPGLSAAAASPAAAPWTPTTNSSITCSRSSSTRSNITTNSSSGMSNKDCCHAPVGMSHTRVQCPVDLVVEGVALLPPPAALAHSLLAQQAPLAALHASSDQQHTLCQATRTTTPAAAQPQPQLQSPGGAATPLQLLAALVAAASCAWDGHHDARHMARRPVQLRLEGRQPASWQGRSSRTAGVTSSTAAPGTSSSSSSSRGTGWQLAGASDIAALLCIASPQHAHQQPGGQEEPSSPRAPRHQVHTHSPGGADTALGPGGGGPGGGCSSWSQVLAPTRSPAVWGLGGGAPWCRLTYLELRLHPPAQPRAVREGRRGPSEAQEPTVLELMEALAVAGTHLELLELHGAGHPAAAGAAGAGAPEASRGRSVAVELGREAWAALAARGGLPQLRFLMLASHLHLPASACGALASCAPRLEHLGLWVHHAVADDHMAALLGHHHHHSTHTYPTPDTLRSPPVTSRTCSTASLAHSSTSTSSPSPGPSTPAFSPRAPGGAAALTPPYEDTLPYTPPCPLPHLRGMSIAQLDLTETRPLFAWGGAPPGLTSLTLFRLAAGSRPLRTAFQGLAHVVLRDWPARAPLEALAGLPTLRRLGLVPFSPYGAAEAAAVSANLRALGQLTGLQELELLRFRTLGGTARTLQQAVRQLPALTALSVSCLSTFSLEPRNPAGPAAHVWGSVFDGLTALKHLTVDAAHSPWDVCRSLLLAAPSLSALRALTLRRVHPVTPRTVRQLLAALPALTHLTLDRCRGPGLDHRVMALGQQLWGGGGAGGGSGTGGRREVQVVWVPEAGADGMGRDAAPRRFVRLRRLLTLPSAHGTARPGAGAGAGAAAAGAGAAPAGAGAGAGQGGERAVAAGMGAAPAPARVRAGVAREAEANCSSAVPAAGAAAAAAEPAARLGTAGTGPMWGVGAGRGGVGRGGAEERRFWADATTPGVRGVGSAHGAAAGGVVGAPEVEGGRGGVEAAAAGGLEEGPLQQGHGRVVGHGDRHGVVVVVDMAAPSAVAARGGFGQAPPGSGPPCLGMPQAARCGVVELAVPSTGAADRSSQRADGAPSCLDEPVRCLEAPRAAHGAAPAACTAGVDAVLPHRREVPYWRRALRRLRGRVSGRLGACWTGEGGGVGSGEE